MRHNTSNSNRRNARTFIASILSYVLLASQLTPLALAANNSSFRGAPTKVSDIARGEKVGRRSVAAEPVSLAPLLITAPNIVATKVDSYPSAPNPANPGEVITYDVTISNTGTADATGVQFNDTIDPNTTLVPGSVNTQPITTDDTYNVLGNVRIQPNAAAGLLVNDIDPDTGTNAGLTASGPATSTQGGSVSVNADGSFSYNPPAGFEGIDTFTYTATDTGGKTDTGTVTLTITGMIWFVNAAAGGGGDGRLTTPFNCLTGGGCFSSVNDGVGNHPAANDNIFLFTGAYTGGLTLLDNQKLIGQAASAPLATIAVVTVPANSDPLPLTGGASPIITSGANGVNIAVGASNTLRGFTIGNTTGAKLASGANFGTLTLGNNAAPDLLLNGTGQALNLTGGTFALTSGLIGVTSTSSAVQGIVLLSVAGTISFGSTTISGNTTQGIFVTASTASINFGNTSCTGGTDGVSLQNNSAGTRTFGTLSVSGGSGNAFLHANGGGNTTIGGAASLASVGDPIEIANVANGTVINFADTSVTKSTATGEGVHWSGTNTGATLSFNSLSVTTTNATGNTAGITASGFGAINVTNPTGSISSSLGPAITANGIALNANFASVSSSGSASTAIGLTNVTGTSNLGGGSLATAAGSTFFVSGGTATVAYNGTITQNTAQRVVDIAGKAGGTITLGGAVSSTSGSGLGINLNSNTGATINFQGGISLTTNANTAFTATAGGTVNVCDESPCNPGATGVLINTLTTTTATALNVANTTIGSNKLEFRSISSNGAANGIILNSTGTNGGLKVSGTGGAGTGGTIQNSTADGVVMTSTDSPDLNWMNISDSAGTAADDGVVITNVTGTVAIANCAITNSPHNGITVDNNNTNMAGFNLTNTTVSCASGQPCQPSGSIGNDGFLLSMRGTSVLTSGLVSACTFSGVRGVAVQIQTNDSGRIGSNSGGSITNSFTIQTSTFTNNAQAIDIDESQVSNLTFQVLNNTSITGTKAAVINAFTSAGVDTGPASHTFVGKIDGNVIGTQGTKDSGSVFGSAIRVVIQGQNTQGNVFVNNNIIHETVNADIMTFISQNGAATTGSGTARFKITNNTMPAPSGSNQAFCGPANTPCAGAGIFVLADEGDPACNIITGNNIYDVTTMNGSSDIYLAERTGPPAGAQLTVEGTGGSNSTFIQANNTLAGASPFLDEGGNTTQVAPSACGIFPTFLDVISVNASFPRSVATETAVAIPVQPTATSYGVSLDVNRPKRDRGTVLHYSAKDAFVPLVAQQPIAQQGKKARGVISIPRLAPTPLTNAGPINIGTLRPGDSVTITFQVTVNNPYLGGPNVSNQGVVSGSNFSSVLTDDPAFPGSADPTLTPINVPPNINVSDAAKAEPASGSAPMLFTVSLSAPAPISGVTVHYATADQAPGPGHAVAGQDYTAVIDSTLNFAAGEQIKTVSVDILADAIVEPDETFLLNLSNATGGNIVDGQAVGTITANAPGTFIISELRTSGPGGAGDDFVELYNNTASQLTVAATDASAGYGVFKMGADCSAVPVLIATVPNGTVIPAHGHYLLVGSTYSLGAAATGDQTLTTDIESDRNVGVFSTADLLNLSSATRLDAVGFGTNTGGNVCDLLREGTNLPAVGLTTTEHSFFRDSCGKKGNPATFGLCPSNGSLVDTNNNATDFIFADTQGTSISGVQQQLGAPGPENTLSPIERNISFATALVDPLAPAASPPNRARDLTPNPGNNSTFGTLSLRRTLTNNTGGNVTRLRFRIIDITSFPAPGGSFADLRALTSSDVTVTVTGGGSVLVRGTTLEQPPTQPNGGALNSTLSAGIITLGTPLAAGASVNVQFVLGVQHTGSFKFYVNIEALP